MTVVLVPLVLLGPLMVLAAAVVSLAAHGPLGWLAGGLLLLAVAASTRWCWRRSCAWWASTAAPVRDPAAARPVPRPVPRPGVPPAGR